MLRILNALGVLLALQLAAAGAVQSQSAEANPAWGRVLAERNRCFQCHGTDGYAIDGDAPHLAGQSETYIVKQLNHYSSGQRQHPYMELFAGNLSATDMADIAAYFTCQGERERDTDRCTRQR